MTSSGKDDHDRGMAESTDYQKQLEQVKDSEGGNVTEEASLEKEVDKINSTVTCVLKSSQGNVPMTFSRLELNTNLHQPPSNWLKSGTPIDARNSWVRGGSGEFSSFRMAKQRPEQVGEVDVISASENIKKLLKIPFNTSQVSMAVHRVEKTLLLDELDLIKMLRHTSETGRDWVKEWILRMVLQDGQTLTTERKTNQMLQNQNLLSKFLCYRPAQFLVKMRRSRRSQGIIVKPVDEAFKYCTENKDKTHFEKRFISDKIGWGIITRTPRVKREFILEYAGDEISAAEAARREIRYEDEGLGSYMFYFGRNKCIDATIDNGRLGRFVNDAVGKKENCVMKPVKISGSTRLCLFAKRDIDAGEELRYDYGIDDLPWRKKQPSALDKGHQEYKPWYDDDDYNPFEDVTLFPNIYSKESSKMIFDNDDISSNMSLSRKGCMENVGVKHPEKDGQQFQSRDTKECQKERFDKGAEKNHIVVDDDSDDTGFLDKGLTEDGPLILKRKENSGKDTNDFLTECDEDGGSTDDDSCDNDSDVAAFSDSNGSKKEEQWQYSSAINGQQASTADTGEEKTRDVAHDDSDQMDFDCQGLIEVKTCNIADDDSDDTGFVVQGLTEDGSVVLKRVGNCGKDTNDFVTDCDEDEGSTDDNSSDNDSDVAAFSDSNGSKKEEQWQYSSAINGQQASTADTGEEKTRDVADDDSDERDFECQGLSEEECPIGDSSESGDDSTSEYSPEDDEYERTSDNSCDNSTDNMNERDSPHGEMNIEPDSTQLDNCEIVEDSEDETQGPSSTIPLPTSSMRRSFNKSQRDTPSTTKARYEPRATDAKHSTSNSCEVSSTTGTTRSTGVRIMVSNRANGQNWDKYQYCVYCLQPKAKMARHFQDMHSDEIEVQEAFSFDKKSAERKSRLRVLTNKGNHAHNLEVLKANCGVIIPYKRPTHNLPVEDYIPCERCFGYFIGSDMWKHLKSCPVTKSVSGRNNGLQSRCSLLLPLPVEVDACFKANVLSIMRRDDVSIICRNDPLILTLGQRLFSSLDKESHNMQYISQKMREMGRLLQAIKAENPSIEALDQCLQPSCFDMVVKAVRVCAGYNTSTQKYSTPSLALKLGHSLKKCSGFMKINGIKAEDDIMRNNAERFEELCNLEWSSTVSSHALTTLSQRKWNKPTILPLSEDIVNLHKHLSTQMAESKEMLSTAPDKLAWNTLASAALSKVILFNRRRSGEVQRMHLKDYESCHGHSSNDVFEGLTNWEQKLCQGLSRVEIKGKRGRKVPILLTSEMREVLDVLVASREVVGVSEENPYLFARPSLGSKTPLRGSDCLATMAIESKAQNPAALTSTKLRKHVATVSQLFCLKNHELDILANFLGHDIRVHREYYRLPDDTLQMTKVARLLLAMEKGNATSFKDKQLKDIEIPLDEPCTSDEEDAESDVDDGHDDNDVNDAGSQEDRDKDEGVLTKVAGRTKSKNEPTQSKQKHTKKVKCSNARMRRPWGSEETERISHFFKKNISVGEQDVANDSSVNEKQDCSVVPLFPPEIQQPEGNEFARQVLWEFEDIRMLIGSDLPIFGEGKYPAVSLRLKDMTSPINVLTGMDYWLDNLMCNVPELVMCYHLNGIVQKYEMLKTEEIPHMEDAKFSTKVVKDIAQNILSFLKSNCTKEGHTYWLYKGKDGDVVKLYDLTSLCENFPNCPWDNPFIVPVALLLYRVAKNMWAMNPTKKQNATISKLLKECVRLLQESGDRHPEISSSAYYMLTLIHINDKYETPMKGSPSKNKFQDSLSSESSDSDGKEIMMPEVKCQELTLPSCQRQKEFQSRKSPKRKVKKADKNETVLEYIVKGLRYIHLSSPSRIPLRPPPQHSGTEKKGSTNETSESNELVTETTSEPERTVTENVPVSSSEISKNQNETVITETMVESGPQSCKSLSVVSKSQAYIAQSDKPEENDKENLTEMKLQHFAANSWQMEQQVVLLSQAAHVYISMAEEQLGKQCYGTALLYCKIGLACNAIKSSFSQTFPNLADQKDLSYRFWVTCGDALLLMTHDPSNFEKYKGSFSFIPEKHTFILAVAEEMMTPEDWSWDIKLNQDKGATIQSSIGCYTKVLEKGKGNPSGFLVSVARKIGNAKNELGVHIMNQATQAYKQKKGREVSTEERDLWAKSLSCFEQGIRAFEEVKDEANTALLLCNSGRLMRLCAQSHISDGSGGGASQLSQSEIHYFHQAFKYYEQALSRLVRRKRNIHVWDAVSWELCTARYTFGCLLQDYPPLNTTSQEEVEREIQECFNKALHLCDLEDKNAASQPLYQYRIASIHHKLASMHHNIFRNQGDPQKQKRTLALVELHYNKAFKYFTQQERHLEVLRIQLERVAVLEHQLTAQTSHNSRIKLFQSVLDIVTSTIDSLNSLKLRCPSSGDEASLESASSLDVVPGKEEKEKLDSQEQQDIRNLLPLLESRLKFNLLGITKQLNYTKSNPKKLELYKKTYATLLASTPSTLNSDDITAERVSTVVDILKQIKSLLKNH